MTDLDAMLLPQTSSEKPTLPPIHLARSYSTGHISIPRFLILLTEDGGACGELRIQHIIIDDSVRSEVAMNFGLMSPNQPRRIRRILGKLPGAILPILVICGLRAFHNRHQGWSLQVPFLAPSSLSSTPHPSRKPPRRSHQQTLPAVQNR